MSALLRIFLVASAIFVLIFIVYKLKKDQIQVSDSLFWLLFSCSFVLLAMFPQVATVISSALGFQAPSNFVFLYVIAVLVIRDFSMTAKWAKCRDRINRLVQEKALDDYKNTQE